MVAVADRVQGGGAPVALQGEIDFVLPIGYRDADGAYHREGRMRLATARDELAPLVDQRVVRNRAYLVVPLLSRVVTRLGTLPAVTPEVVEGLYATDFGHIQALDRRPHGDPPPPAPAWPHRGEP